MSHDISHAQNHAHHLLTVCMLSNLCTVQLVRVCPLLFTLSRGLGELCYDLTRDLDLPFEETSLIRAVVRKMGGGGEREREGWYEKGKIYDLLQ